MEMMFEVPILSLVIWLPIAGAVWVLIAGDRGKAARSVALAVALATFVVSIPLYLNFESSTHEMQFVERAAWIPAYGIRYHVGVDGISMPLVLLTTFTTVLVVLAGWEVIRHRQAQYMAALLFQEGFMNGAFASLDSILFYVFWEAQLIPMFIIIGVWGGPRRVYATVKFFLYTFLGSVVMLIALLYLYKVSGTFSILELHQVRIGLTPQTLLFMAFLVAFAVKVPMWPVHTWLPDAHVEAPTGGSVILAAIMLKLGAYGFLRFSLPIAPDAGSALDWLMIALSLIAVVYVGFVAIVQPDMKKLIAYSSVAHMGFTTLGFFLVFRLLAADDLQGAVMGMQGGMVQMISHGFISGALFLCVGVMYDRLHSRQIADYGGVVNTMPIFAAFMMLFALANSGLPGTSGFVGEFFVILSSFKASFWIAFLAATTLVLGAAYSLWMYKRVIYGPVVNEGVASLDDIGLREAIILGALAVAVLWLGVWPAPLLEVMEATVQNLVLHVGQSKLN